MPLNVDRIRQLAEQDDSEIPDMTTEQAEQAVRLLAAGRKPAASISRAARGVGWIATAAALASGWQAVAELHLPHVGWMLGA